jgi:uncharacterized protein YkwD
VGYRLLSCLVLLAVCFDVAASDLYPVINRVRVGEGGCGVARNLTPLRPQAALERAARNLSQGVPLQQSLREVGYGAARASALSITGEGVGGPTAGRLVERSYCRELQDAAMTEVGVYQEARQIWIIMAAPAGQSIAPARSAEFSGQAAGQRILDLVNQARATPRICGNERLNAAQPVRWNGALADASRQHSEEMARYNYFSHQGRDGSDPGDRVERAGYRYRFMGENIAAGQRSPDDAVAGWIKSPDHCANLMNPAFTEMGAAVAVNASSELGMFWTQEFARPH